MTGYYSKIELYGQARGILRENIKNDGFTLIELLVVIGIIAILASIIFVSTNTGRQKAREVYAAAHGPRALRAPIRFMIL